MIVNYKRPGVHNAEGIILKPGANAVDVKEWAKVRVHPMIKMAIESGEIVEESEVDESMFTTMTKDEDQAGEDSILSGMKIPQAKGLVEETTDLELLNRWKRTENRNQVIGAIKAQLEKVQAPAEKREEMSHQQTVGVGVKTINVANPGDRE